jgi:hypothetical protein
MAEHGDEQPVRVARIDGHLGNLLAVAQAEMCPRLAGIGRFVDAVAGRQVRPRQTFAAADIDDVGIGRRYRDPSDGSGRLVVEDWLPRAAGIGSLPDAAIADADVEGVGLARHAGHRLRPSAAVRADRAPAHLGEEIRIDLRRLRRHRRG